MHGHSFRQKIGWFRHMLPHNTLFLWISLLFRSLCRTFWSPLPRLPSRPVLNILSSSLFWEKKKMVCGTSAVLVSVPDGLKTVPDGVCRHKVPARGRNGSRHRRKLLQINRLIESCSGYRICADLLLFGSPFGTGRSRLYRWRPKFA